MSRLFKIAQFPYPRSCISIAVRAVSQCAVKNPEVLEREKTLHDEMSALCKLQFEELQRAVFIPLTRDQAEEYDVRGRRIGQICKLLDIRNVL